MEPLGVEFASEQVEPWVEDGSHEVVVDDAVAWPIDLAGHLGPDVQKGNDADRVEVGHSLKRGELFVQLGETEEAGEVQNEYSNHCGEKGKLAVVLVGKTRTISKRKTKACVTCQMKEDEYETKCDK